MNNSLLLSMMFTLVPLQVSAAGYAASYKPVGVCIEVPVEPNVGKTASHHLSVRSYAANLVSYHADEQFAFDYENAKVTLLKSPKHGALSMDWVNGLDVFYAPHRGYSGEDSAVFAVNIEGNDITVRYRLIIRVGPSNKNHKNRCPDPNWWEIQ